MKIAWIFFSKDASTWTEYAASLFLPTICVTYNIRVILKVSHPIFILSLGLLFDPYPLFQWYPQSKEILLNLCMKCWNSAI
jgi:hypothetical protein